MISSMSELKPINFLIFQRLLLIRKKCLMGWKGNAHEGKTKGDETKLMYLRHDIRAGLED